MPSGTRLSASSPGSSSTAILPTFRTNRSPHRYSDGPLTGRIIARKLGRITTPWQQYVLDVALERVDGPGSPFAYTDISVIVGRRGGKTVTTMGVPLARAQAGPVDIGYKLVPFFAAHTAQNVVSARRRFLKDLVEPYRELMSPAVWSAGHRLKTGMTETSLTIDAAQVGKDWRNPRASTIQVFAPTPSSVRGDGLLHLTFDEALIFNRDEGANLLAAAGPTMSTLGGHAQIWVTSNVSRFNDSKTWLYELCERGRDAVRSGRTTGFAHFEFTIPEDADPNDEQVWWDYYPGLGDGLVRVEELRAEVARLGVDSFAAEYLGRWPSQVAIAAWAALSEAVWRAGATEAEPAAGARAIGVDLDPFGRSSSIVAAGAHPDEGRETLVEVLDHRAGSGWLVDAVRDLADSVDSIGVDDYGPGHELLLELERDPVIASKLVRTKSLDFVAACFAFDRDLREGRLQYRSSTYHRPLTDAAAAAQRTPGKAWQWERRVSVSQTPLVGATLAAWGLTHPPTPAAFFVA